MSTKELTEKTNSTTAVLTKVQPAAALRDIYEKITEQTQRISDIDDALYHVLKTVSTQEVRDIVEAVYQLNQLSLQFEAAFSRKLTKLERKINK